MRLGAGRESGNLLMSQMHPLDLSLAADGIRESVQTVADDSVDAFHAGHRECLGELIGNRFHDRVPILGFASAGAFTRTPSHDRTTCQQGVDRILLERACDEG
jgi:hypothetical protein